MILSLSDSILAYAAIAGSGREGERATVSALIPELFGDIPGRPLSVSHNPDGSPFIEGFKGNMSISHGGGIAVIARNDSKPIGIDIEAPRPQLEKVSRKFVGNGDFLPENLTSIDWLLRLWTAKEAVYKAASRPGLSLMDINIITPVTAIIPDGRKYRLTTYRLIDNLITLAEME